MPGRGPGPATGAPEGQSGRGAGRGASRRAAPGPPSAGRTARSGCRGTAPPATRRAGPGGDPQLGVGGGLLPEGQRDPLSSSWVSGAGRASLSSSIERRWISAEPHAAGLVEGCVAHLLEELLDHRADAHDLGRLLDQVGGVGRALLVLRVRGHTHAVLGDHDDALLLRLHVGIPRSRPGGRWSGRAGGSCAHPASRAPGAQQPDGDLPVRRPAAVRAVPGIRARGRGPHRAGRLPPEQTRAVAAIVRPRCSTSTSGAARRFCTHEGVRSLP